MARQRNQVMETLRNLPFSAVPQVNTLHTCLLYVHVHAIAGYEWRGSCLVLLPWCGRCAVGDEVVDAPLKPLNHNHFGTPHCKTGGVPDKLCVFPADES